MLSAGDDYTLVLSGLLGDEERYPLRLLTFVDDNSEPDDGQGKLRWVDSSTEIVGFGLTRHSFIVNVRFIHVAAGFKALDVMLGDTRLFRKVGYGEHGELIGNGDALLMFMLLLLC